MNDHKSARMNVDSYPRSLTPEEVDDGKRRAEEFLAQRPWFRKSQVQKSWNKFKEWFETPDRPY